MAASDDVFTGLALTVRTQSFRRAAMAAWTRACGALLGLQLALPHRHGVEAEALALPQVEPPHSEGVGGLPSAADAGGVSVGAGRGVEAQGYIGHQALRGP